MAGAILSMYIANAPDSLRLASSGIVPNLSGSDVSQTTPFQCASLLAVGVHFDMTLLHKQSTTKYTAYECRLCCREPRFVSSAIGKFNYALAMAIAFQSDTFPVQ